jgi:N-methylhydantoinase A/oxoprolinase/acetone carboxylase beta subunit
MASTRLGIDIGSTFTDLVVLPEGELVTAKVPSTPQDQSVGVMNAIGASGIEPDELAVLAHGMTVATNTGCVANPSGNLVSRRSFAVIGIQVITEST